MINSARTLLLNVDGVASGYAGYPGEEFIPPQYRAVTLPGFQRTIRDVLFGSQPDRLMLNYRGRQLMGLLHSTELVEYVLSRDPRITYDTLPADTLFDSLFHPRVTPLGGTTAQLFMQVAAAPAQSNRLQHAWTVTIIDGNTAEVRRHTAPAGAHSLPYTTSSGLSSPVSLVGSGRAVRFEVAIGSSWYIEVADRPSADLGTVLVRLDAVLEPVKLQLFGIGSALGANEPFKTFRNLYRDHPELPYRLGGLVLAQIYQTAIKRKQ